ncbi:MAG: MBL fold metallo-hydrolase [Spirochaetia bacterium]|nr:MBL fold metallo-hydrolase [Spirochaetia bacterium]
MDLASLVKKKSRWIVVGLLVIAAAWLAYRLNDHPSLEPYKRLYTSAESAKEARLNVTWFGVSTLLFDDGKTAIMIDGFFSRPSRFQTFFVKVGPDRQIVSQALQRAGIKHTAAVIAVHSHYDHAMDAPLVAELTGGTLVGSDSTANIGRGWGLPESQIRVIHNMSYLTYGDFKITFIESHHSPSPFGTGGEVSAPLVPPVRANKYFEGGSYSVLIEHGGRKVLVHASAGFSMGALHDIRADVVFLGIATVGKQRAPVRNAYWREVVESTRPRVVIPIHWDDFWLPADQFKPMPRLLDDFEAGMKFVEARAKAGGVQVRLVEYGRPFPL